MKNGQSLVINWKRPPGRPRKTWIQQIGNGTPASWRHMWQSADERGHRGESPQRTFCLRVMMMMMMMMGDIWFCAGERVMRMNYG